MKTVKLGKIGKRAKLRKNPRRRTLVPTKIGSGNRYVTCRKNNVGEWVCRLWIDGKHYKPADYFAADPQDASDTMQAMYYQGLKKNPRPKRYQPAPRMSGKFRRVMKKYRRKAAGKTFDHPKSRFARGRKYRMNPRINGINRNWQTFAGGTGAHHGSSYAMYLENRAMFDINPPQRRGGSYSLRSFNVTAPHWVHHGWFRSPQAAKAEAKRILESGEGAQRFARNPKSRAFLHVAKTAHRPSFRVGVKQKAGSVHYFDTVFHSLAKARKVAQASANAARAVYVVKRSKA